MNYSTSEALYTALACMQTVMIHACGSVSLTETRSALRQGSCSMHVNLCQGKESTPIYKSLTFSCSYKFILILNSSVVHSIPIPAKTCVLSMTVMLQVSVKSNIVGCTGPQVLKLVSTTSASNQ